MGKDKNFEGENLPKSTKFPNINPNFTILVGDLRKLCLVGDEAPGVRREYLVRISCPGLSQSCWSP